jgi:DNA mismatch endonuclease (patch repair protein)
MADVLTPEQRSRCMSRIRAKNTGPELVVRSIAHRMGYRFRLHPRGLPGRPDLVFPRLRKIVFVHGCFWHMHRCKYGIVTPATRATFWRTKRKQNADRDRRNLRAVRKLGWSVLVLWECDIRHRLPVVERKLTVFLGILGGSPHQSRAHVSRRGADPTTAAHTTVRVFRRPAPKRSL